MRYMLQNLTVDCDYKKLNMHAMCFEKCTQCAEKKFVMNTCFKLKLLQIKLPLFHIFHVLHEFNFLETCIYVNEAMLLIFDWEKYTSNTI